MRRALIFVLVLLPLGLRAGQVFDRIVARVDHHVVLASEWDEAVRYEAFMDGKDLAAIDDAARQATLERLIDQELVQAEIDRTNFVPAPAAEIDSRLAELRKQHPAGGSDATWKAALEKYGLSEADIRERVTMQVNEMRFLDQRFRPSVHIDPRTVEAYYRDTYLPATKKDGARPLALADARDQIEEILVQQRMDDQIAAWLKNLREQTTIERGEPQSPLLGLQEKKP